VAAIPSPPKIGQDRRPAEEWAFHFPPTLGNLWELLFAVTESFSPKAFQIGHGIIFSWEKNIDGCDKTTNNKDNS
jgi:hypothetical protein